MHTQHPHITHLHIQYVCDLLVSRYDEYSLFHMRGDVQDIVFPSSHRGSPAVIPAQIIS